MQVEEIQSKAVNFLRFPFMVGVVLLHNPVPLYFRSRDIHLDIFYDLFSSIIPVFIVPFFFFISGYFFFNKPGFGTKVYFEKIGKRAKTLLVPYVFWTAAWLVAYYLLYNSPLVGGFLGKGREYSVRYILEAFWCSLVPDALRAPPGNPTILPEIGQFWYLRDLMCVLIWSPVLHYFIKRIGVIFVIILGLAWLAGLRIPCLGDRGLSLLALFFVSGGAWFGIKQKNFLSGFLTLRHSIFILYPLSLAAALLLLYCSDYGVFSIALRISILCAIPFFVNFVALLFEKKHLKDTPFLSSAAFLVFALHQPWILLFFRKLFLKNTVTMSCGNGLFYYCLYPVLVIAICLPLHYLLRRFLPRLNNLLTGGR
ncbi:MAG: acyltransferase family protein [Puniceicoccales bacterium]|jgi:fucose 4-O-acetylase-like acetyltransferase|nr:acyltransferase family protein [Puniceicoccales bacterium]